jgi:hypothetical protein
MEILSDDSENEEVCEVEPCKISRVLDSINEVMNWIERVIVIISIFYICKTLRHDEETSLAVIPKENIVLF